MSVPRKLTSSTLLGRLSFETVYCLRERNAMVHLPGSRRHIWNFFKQTHYLSRGFRMRGQTDVRTGVFLVQVLGKMAQLRDLVSHDVRLEHID